MQRIFYPRLRPPSYALTLYKYLQELGITPFYTLKPMIPFFIQSPILIAIFNALGKMPQFQDQGFLWVTDFSYLDIITNISLSISLLGSNLRLLRFIMEVATVTSTLILDDMQSSKTEIKKQKRNLYFLAKAFVILFYPFPAAMVLYWALASILQNLQQLIVRKIEFRNTK